MKFRAEASSIEKAVRDHRLPLCLDNPEHQKQVEDVISVFQLPGETILKFADVFTQQMENGLRYDKSSPFTMQSTFVYSLLDGSEEGKFLGMDLGGTNFRVVLVEVAGGKIVNEQVAKYEIKDSHMMGHGKELFDHIARSLLDFTEKHGVSKDNLPLGFTFSFPLDQTSLDNATLSYWVGQYTASGVVGENVVKMLRDAISRTDTLVVDVVAILNDTTGTLLRGSLIDKDTAISLILGTGSNACYVEKTSRMTGWTGPEEEAVLNIEWGPLPDNGLVDFINTKYDKEADKLTTHPGFFLLEKYIGGMCFGDIVRFVLLDLIENKALFEGKNADLLQKPGSFPTPWISDIEQDNLDNVSKRTEIILSKIGIDSYTQDDVKIIKYVGQELSIRMALLTAACIGEIVKRIDRPKVTVAVDGSVFKYHPRLRIYMTDFTAVLVGHQKTVRYIHAEDGSGTGAALLAALARKNRS